MKLRELQPLIDMQVASGWGDSEVVARLGLEYYAVSDFNPSNAEGTADHCEIVLGRIGKCICARCAKYDGCPNAAPDKNVPGFEGICADCRENQRHAGHTPCEDDSAWTREPITAVEAKAGLRALGFGLHNLTLEEKKSFVTLMGKIEAIAEGV